MIEGLEEFKRRVRGKSNHPPKHRITNSLGVYDGFKYYRKNKPKGKEYVLTESQYFHIVRAINNLLAEEIVRGEDVKLPCRMGTIELRKVDRKVYIDKNGNVQTNLPIDWNKTLELWYEDEEAYKNKTLVKMDEKEIFKIYYNRELANYNNKTFYEFSFNRDIKVRLKRMIKEGLIDAPYKERKVKLW